MVKQPQRNPQGGLVNRKIQIPLWEGHLHLHSNFKVSIDHYILRALGWLPHTKGREKKSDK